MNEEGVFPRLLELIGSKPDDDADLKRMLLQLLYEMSRIQRIRTEELSAYTATSVPTIQVFVLMYHAVLIEDDFIIYLLQIIEGLSNDVNDPYHYPVIRVLVCLPLQSLHERLKKY